MKLLNTLILLVLSFFALHASAQKKTVIKANTTKVFIIKGKLTNVEDGVVVSLMQQLGNVGMSVTSDTIRDGRFILRWNVENSNDTEKYSLSFFGSEGFPSMSLDIWASAGASIEVTGNDKYLYTWDVKSDLPEQAERSRFINASKKDWIEYQRISAQRSELYKDIDNITQEEYKKIRIIADSLDKLSEPIHNNINKTCVELLQQDATVSNIGLENLKGLSLYISYTNDSILQAQIEELYERLSDEQKNSREGRAIHTNLFPPQVVKVGEAMADTDLYDTEGNKYRLSDFKGEYILLDFWSMGCGPCIMAMPEMKELTEQYKDKLNIVSLSIDDDKAWKKSSTMHEFTWKNLSDGMENSGIAAKYGVNGIPHYVMISPDGIVIDSWSGYGKDSLKRKMNEYIKE